ncbi:hypothetical protein RvY_11770 [Ramazzottius varieornatus]|uniref:Uncharacterized protein n=1 Tax=Ramazzottius varieornatus TaxID=947166 RepID=A0A1D1VJ82_RAMVA|nr:hypothetical protein RvY_11770 [Ramazzottius varieornatus]
MIKSVEVTCISCRNWIAPTKLEEYWGKQLWKDMSYEDICPDVKHWSLMFKIWLENGRAMWLMVDETTEHRAMQPRQCCSDHYN